MECIHHLAVSIITPVYKAPVKYFTECLNSLQNQTMPNIEFVIVFDGINRELQAICESYQKNDPRFKIFIQPHSGVSSARNFGIEHAKGDFITFVDADDSIERNCCLETYNFAKKNESQVVLFDYIPVDNQYSAKQMFSESILLLPNSTIETLKRQAIYLTDEKYVAAVSTWCKLVKRDFILSQKIKFSTKLKICVDRPVSYSIFHFAKKISYLHKTFYNYNKVDTSITWSRYDDKFPLIMSYLTEIKCISNKSAELIGRRAMEMFLVSWSTNYFTPQKKNHVYDTVKNILKIAKSPNFQWLIEKYDSSRWPFSVKLEAFLIKHKISFHIWIHAFKWKLLKR